jgi:ketosteroid isomerase-like protein
MALSSLPQPIIALLQATASRDRAGVLASFADDAVLIDMGEEHRGEEIARWTDSLYLGSNVRVHPLHVEERDGHTVLAVAVDGDYAALGVAEPFQLEWHIDLAGDRIARLRMVEEKPDLPAPVLGFVQAMNMYDLDGMVSRFAPDAIANDQMRHYKGREAIRAWLAKEIAGDRVTMFVTEILRHPGGVAVRAKVTGDYDKTGLPDPLELRFYFALAGDAIAQLVVIPEKHHA